ncbi:hypothetical protein HGH93_12135 [Chitinophaga polysaccharea]|uniref:hypothetical protein n=1 Tax=Chitinophaga polysaccharea TaxID=1293035 RepID=UPI0014555561|nr:hypothetical protein [Chitinophaga polysaccharea]NLR58856.1 hypothetical protein [Chitinophaga polysaccharea]
MKHLTWKEIAIGLMIVLAIICLLSIGLCIHLVNYYIGLVPLDDTIPQAIVKSMWYGQ